jgi:hypothetical protein
MNKSARSNGADNSKKANEKPLDGAPKRRKDGVSRRAKELIVEDREAPRENSGTKIRRPARKTALICELQAECRR